MLRRITGACALIAGIGALLAPNAGASAFLVAKHAGEKSDSGFSTVGSAGSSGAQTFVAGPFRVFCAVARSTGLTKPDSGFYSESIKFSKCETGVFTEEGTEIRTLPATFSAPLRLLYDATPGMPTGVIAADTIEIKPLKCTISIPSQFLADTSPTGSGAGKPQTHVAYSTVEVPTKNLHHFPSGLQPKLQIENDLVGEATFSGCGALQPSRLTYTGKILDEVSGGLMGWNANIAPYRESPLYALPELPEGWAQEGDWIGYASEHEGPGWERVHNEPSPEEPGEPTPEEWNIKTEGTV